MNLSTHSTPESGSMDPPTDPHLTDAGGVSTLNESAWNTSSFWSVLNSSVTSVFDNITMFNLSTTVPTNGTEEDVRFDVGSRVTLIILYTIISVTAVIGNTIAIVVFVKGHRSRTDLRPFLINLAVADLIMAIICIPFTFTYQLIEEWIFSDPMCPIVTYLQQVAVTASVSTNMAVGVDRFFAITCPLKKRLTTSRSKYVIVLIWFIALTLNIVQIIVGKAQTRSGKRQCTEDWPEPSEVWVTSYTLFLMFITYVIPLTILTVTYSMVGRILWRRHLPGHADELRDAHQLKSKRKIVKMLVTIVLLFGLCWLPLHTFFLLESFMPDFSGPHEKVVVYYACHWLAMANSFVNPLIYGFMNDSYRADVKSLFHACPCWRHKITYRPGARRWKMGNNVSDISYTVSDTQAAHGLLALKDSGNWHNGNMYDHSSVLYLTKSC